MAAVVATFGQLLEDDAPTFDPAADKAAVAPTISQPADVT
jgi:hypothetical protein